MEPVFRGDAPLTLQVSTNGQEQLGNALLRCSVFSRAHLHEADATSCSWGMGHPISSSSSQPSLQLCRRWESTGHQTQWSVLGLIRGLWGCRLYLSVVEHLLKQRRHHNGQRHHNWVASV